MGNISGEIIKPSIKTLLEKLTLEKIFLISQTRGFGCALYCLPNSNVKHLIIDRSGGSDLDHLQIDEMGKGFIFHPFSSKRHPIKFIDQDLHFSENIETKNIELLSSKSTPDKLMELFDTENIYASKDSNENGQDKSYQINDQKTDFLKLINKTIQEIKESKFQKVVIARNKMIELPEKFNPFDLFNSLSDQYNNAFVYMTFIPEVGSWLGATPETLINIDKTRQFQTVALAATQAYRNDQDLEDTTWSQKDIEEQAMVSRYIINCFKKIRLREFEEIGPRTHLSGNLVHLKTDYNVDMDQVAFPQLGSVMLELLHPTSAVCGMPKESANDFIQENEDFDREYFSGFLGPVNLNEETNIFVNLRCMKVMKHYATLFAGAGIIVNSNPEKEWNETEIKMQTLLKVFREMY